MGGISEILTTKDKTWEEMGDCEKLFKIKEFSYPVKVFGAFVPSNSYEGVVRMLAVVDPVFYKKYQILF